MQLLIAPLLPYLQPENPPSVFGVSGYSGAGTKSGNTPKITPESLEGAIRPYALTDHIHEREASRHLSNIAPSPFKLAFVPVVAPWFSGIISTVSVPISKKLRASEVRDLFEDKYRGEHLVKIQKGVPEIKDIAGKHGFVAGGFQVHSSGERVVVVVRLSSSSSVFVDEGCTGRLGQSPQGRSDTMYPKSQHQSRARRVRWHRLLEDKASCTPSTTRSYIQAFRAKALGPNFINVDVPFSTTATTSIFSPVLSRPYGEGLRGGRLSFLRKRLRNQEGSTGCAFEGRVGKLSTISAS
jgi:hypothetical protein